MFGCEDNSPYGFLWTESSASDVEGDLVVDDRFDMPE
jgi:hypothetical protein